MLNKRVLIFMGLWALSFMASPLAFAMNAFPGYIEDVVVTVKNDYDSVGSIPESYFVVESPPDTTIMSVSWSEGVLSPGTTRQCRVRYQLSEGLPTGTYALKIKMVAPTNNIYPREQYIVNESAMHVDATPPVVTFSPDTWFNYAASSSSFQGEVEQPYVLTGPNYFVKVNDPDSYVASFQILNSSGVDISPLQVYNTTHTYSLRGHLPEGEYAIKAYSYARLPTTASLKVDYTPEVSVDTATTVNQNGSFISDIFLSVRSYWGVKSVKLIPAGSGNGNITSAAQLAETAAVPGGFQEYPIPPTASSVTFSGVPIGEYYIYALNGNDLVSAQPAYFAGINSGKEIGNK